MFSKNLDELYLKYSIDNITFLNLPSHLSSFIEYYESIFRFQLFTKLYRNSTNIEWFNYQAQLLKYASSQAFNLNKVVHAIHRLNDLCKEVHSPLIFEGNCENRTEISNSVIDYVETIVSQK